MYDFRVAEFSDIKQIQVVRYLVKENTLSNPDLVPDKDVAHYLGFFNYRSSGK